MPQAYPQPRIDLLVNDAFTGERRRQTEYSGTLWFGDPPALGPVRMFTKTGIQEDAGLFLPDSLPYIRAELGDATLTCSAALQAHSGESTHIIDARAEWADDPRGGEHTWIALRVVVAGSAPLAVAYRVVAVGPPWATPG